MTQSEYAMEDSISSSISHRGRRSKLVTPHDESSYLIPATHSSVDRGWAWGVLVGSCLCNAIFIGLSSSIGVLYVDIRQRLDISVFQVSIIGSLRNGFLYFFVGLATPLCGYVECRVVALIGAALGTLSYLAIYLWPTLPVFYVFLGGMTGLSSAMVYGASLMAIHNYFETKKSLAIGWSLAAGSVGTLSLSPLIAYLLSVYGLEGTLLINTGISFNIFVGAMMYFPQQNVKETDLSPKATGMLDAIRVYQDKWIWKNSYLYLVLVSTLCYGFGLFVPFFLLPDYMVSQGIPLETSSLSVTVQGAAQALARMIVGVVSHRFPRFNRLLYILTCATAGISVFVIISCRSAVEYIMASTAFGFSYGYLSALMTVLLVELFSPERLPACFGIQNFLFGIGSLIGSPIASVIAETVPVRGIEYIVAGTALSISGLVMVPTLFVKRDKSDNN